MSGGIGAVTGTGMDSQRNAVYVPDGDRRDGGTARHRHPGRVDDKAASITDLPVRVVGIVIVRHTGAPKWAAAQAARSGRAARTSGVMHEIN